MLRSIPLLMLTLMLANPAMAQSRSIGDTSHGSLETGDILPVKGTGFSFLPVVIERGYRYGLHELTGLVRRLGATLHAKHQLHLQLGNLSRKGGGDIPQSRSHNSGRDVDIAFLMNDRAGNRVKLKSFGLVNEHLTDIETGFVFDVDHNWLLVRSILLDEHIDIAWIFVSRPIRSALLKRAREESLSLQLAATTVLRQPSDSAPHDDHYHVRMYCPLDQLEFCEERVTRWPWIPPRPTPTSTSDLESPAATSAEPTRTERLRQLSQLAEWNKSDIQEWNRLTNQATNTPEAASLWLKEHDALSPREAWNLGYRVQGCLTCIEGGLDERVSALIRAVKESPTIRYRALRDLPLLTGNPKGTWNWTAKKAHRYWAKWWRQNRHRYGL